MNQKGFINITLVIIVVVLVGAGAYFVSTRQITLPTQSPVPSPAPSPVPTPTPTPAPARSTEPTTDNSKPASQKFLVVSDKYFSNLETLDELTENHPLVQQIIPSDFTFKIHKYTALVLSENGKVIAHTDIPNWQKIQQELKSLNLTNRKIIQARGKDVAIELLEWHSQDPATKQFCTLDGSFCETEHQWFRISVNGYKANIYREEGRTFTFNDGTKINILVADDDVDFMVKVLKN